LSTVASETILQAAREVIVLVLVAVFMLWGTYQVIRRG
jgi:hypothetical protein